MRHAPRAADTRQDRFAHRWDLPARRTLLTPWYTHAWSPAAQSVRKSSLRTYPHPEGAIAWAQARVTDGLLKAPNGLLQAAKRRPGGDDRLATIRTVISRTFSRPGFFKINLHVWFQRA